MDSSAESNCSLALASKLDDIHLQSQCPINGLPTEMLRVILIKIQILQAIPLRSVSSRWKAVIESICLDKKCLIIVNNLMNKNYRSELSKRFNWQQFKLNCKDFVVFTVKHNPQDYEARLSGQLCTLLAKLFPCVEQFYISVKFSVYFSAELSAMLKQWRPTLTTLSFSVCVYEEADVAHFCAQINKLTQLRQFGLDNTFSNNRALVNQLAPTLARLEHFSGWIYNFVSTAAPYLGSGFSSFGTGHIVLFTEAITNWHRLNAPSVSNLERFSLSILEPEAFPLICEHFSSLQMLHIEPYSLQLSNMIGNLSRLTNLVELRIDFVHIHLATLDVSTNLRRLRNIRILSLMGFTFVDDEVLYGYCSTLPENVDVQFCRFLYTIFPNVEHLTIKSDNYPLLGKALELHVNKFANLRSHDFQLA